MPTTGLVREGTSLARYAQLPAATNPPTLMLTRLLLLIRRAIGTPSLLGAESRLIIGMRRWGILFV